MVISPKAAVSCVLLANTISLSPLLTLAVSHLMLYFLINLLGTSQRLMQDLLVPAAAFVFSTHPSLVLSLIVQDQLFLQVWGQLVT